MKRIFALLLSLVLLSALIPAQAEAESSLIIGVVSQTDAWNVVLEEAFFETHPDVTIEYRLYTEEQLNALMLTGESDLDLVILPYATLLNMAQKGYLASVYEALGQDTYPEQLLDYSELLTCNGELFALPVSVSQSFWIWDNQVAAKIGIEMPDADSWTWDAYAELARKLPCKVETKDGEDEPDVYLMQGAKVMSYPEFSNVNLGMFKQYAAQYTDFDLFAEKYLDLFREIICNDALLSMQSDEGQVLLMQAASDTPLHVLSYEFPYVYETDTITVQMTIDEMDGYRLLPPAKLDENQQTYAGTMTACSVLKTAPHDDLAAAFIQSMISPKALEYALLHNEDHLVGHELPTFYYFDMNSSTMPVFTIQNETSVYRVTAGREILISEFMYSREAFEKAQEYRSKLAINTVLLSRDFYDAAWSNLSEWYGGRMTDAELIDAMNFLFGMAHEE